MLTTAQIYADVPELDARLTGSAVGPGDDGWDEARLAWNLAVDQRPAMVVCVETVEDVQAVVDYARERGLRVAPQGTGHNAAALGSLEHTVLLKTHRMRGVTVDAANKVVRAEAGAVWLDVTSQTAKHKLVPPLGSSPDVGVVGMTLGGGFCWLGRKVGLAADNVVAIELVTADGAHVRVTGDDDSGLFWALRGGGGSFGVVTAIELRLFDIPEIYGTSIFFPIERGAEVLHVWREFVDTLTEDTTSYARFLQFPPIPEIPEPMRGGRFINVEIVHLGSEEAGVAVSQAIRDLGPAMELAGMHDAESLNHFHLDPEEPVPASGGAHMILEKFDAEAAEAFNAVGGADSRSPLLLLEIRHVEGALSRRAENGGALGRFDGRFIVYGAGMVMDGDMAVAVESHLERVAAALVPWDGGHRYLNFVEHPADTRTMFTSQDYARLREVKAMVDPSEVIQSNHPIPPAR